jgi:hypothetical protein
MLARMQVVCASLRPFTVRLNVEPSSWSIALQDATEFHNLHLCSFSWGTTFQALRVLREGRQTQKHRSQNKSSPRDSSCVGECSFCGSLVSILVNLFVNLKHQLRTTPASNAFSCLPSSEGRTATYGYDIGGAHEGVRPP